MTLPPPRFGRLDAAAVAREGRRFRSATDRVIWKGNRYGSGAGVRRGGKDDRVEADLAGPQATCRIP
ncbi:MAG: hypothetical protein HZA54_19940 [Planctomycetes bacterium]|nr:hypothetical protein [Planctomycetota bacterium]